MQAANTEGVGGVNSTVIMSGQGGYFRPLTLIDAISEIQQFYVIESKGQSLPKEMLSLNATIDFFKIGVLSGLKEGLFLFFLFPVFDLFIVPILLKRADLFTQWLLWLLPFLIVAVNTILCSYISRYYIGNVTRKAINVLLSGRSVAILSKAMIIVVFYRILSYMATPERIASITNRLGKYGDMIYDGFFSIHPYLIKTSTQAALILVAAAVFPFTAVWIIDVINRWRINRSMRKK